MANRNFNRKQALEKEVKEIFAEIQFTNGDGTPVLVRGTGVASVAKTGPGTFLVTLQDKYMRLMHASATILAAAVDNIQPQIQSEDVAGAKTVTVVTQNAGSETNPQDDTVLLLKLDLKNSSAL